MFCFVVHLSVSFKCFKVKLLVFLQCFIPNSSAFEMHSKNGWRQRRNPKPKMNGMLREDLYACCIFFFTTTTKMGDHMKIEKCAERICDVKSTQNIVNVDISHRCGLWLPTAVWYRIMWLSFDWEIFWM